MSQEQPQPQPQQPEKITLHPSNPLHAIEIIDQLLQPGVQMNRQAWTVAESCVASIRNALSKPNQE
jgi:hypothetical protein